MGVIITMLPTLSHVNCEIIGNKIVEKHRVTFYQLDLLILFSKQWLDKLC